MSPVPPSTSEENRSPRLLLLTIALSLVLWIIATTGGRQVFVKEWLGEAYDSQAEHFLRGDPGVDSDAIRSEALLVNGQIRMYFGPFPAFVRVPLNFLYPAGRGYWARTSGFCAGAIALVAFAGLVSMGLRSSQLSHRWRNWLGNACLVGFVFGSPLLLLLGCVTIYHEAILWGLAWSLAALYFAGRSRKAEGTVLTRSLLAFSFCVGGALLSRATFGAPFFLIAPVLAFPLLRKERRIRNLAALFLPLGTALLFYLLLTYAKFGSLRGMDMNYSINGVQKEFAQKHGIFRLERVPYSFADYFFLRWPELQNSPPFMRTGRAPYDHPTLYVMPFTETYSSLLWCSPWILMGAIMGMVLLLRPRGSDGLDRGIAVGLFTQVIVILSFMGLAQRYVAEFFPFLIFCFILFLQRGGTALCRMRYALIGLIALSVVINSLTTTSWHAGDPNTPIGTRVFWNMLIGKTLPH